jgi:hypothetical protein
MSSDDDDELPCCDWCSKGTKRRSLVMGYTDGSSDNFLWGKGDMICSSCLNKSVKPKLYQVKLKGRNMFATRAYFNKYWRTEDGIKVLKAPTQRDCDEEDDSVTEEQKPMTEKKRKREAALA